MSGNYLACLDLTNRVHYTTLICAALGRGQVATLQQYLIPAQTSYACIVWLVLQLLTQAFALWCFLNIIIQICCNMHFKRSDLPIFRLSVFLPLSLSPCLICLSPSIRDTGMFYLSKVHHSAVISPETARELMGITLQTGCSSQDSTRR